MEVDGLTRELMELVERQTDRSYDRSICLGYLLIELAATGFPTPMVASAGLEIAMAPMSARGVEERIAELLVNTPDGVEVFSGPFSAEAVKRSTRAILELEAKWSALTPAGFVALSDYVAREAAGLMELDSWRTEGEQACYVAACRQ